jgi:hypothetical protein
MQSIEQARAELAEEEKRALAEARKTAAELMKQREEKLKALFQRWNAKIEKGEDAAMPPELAAAIQQGWKFQPNGDDVNVTRPPQPPPPRPAITPATRGSRGSGREAEPNPYDQPATPVKPRYRPSGFLSEESEPEYDSGESRGRTGGQHNAPNFPKFDTEAMTRAALSIEQGNAAVVQFAERVINNQEAIVKELERQNRKHNEVGRYIERISQ